MSKKNPHPAITVASAKNGFRRGGHEFGMQPKTIALAALHPDAHAAIIADKSLVVIESSVHLDETEAAALAHHDADHVKQAAAKLTSLPAAGNEDHAKRAAALSDIEAELKQREADVREREATLDQRKAELDAAAEAIAREKAELDEQRAAFEAQCSAHDASKHAHGDATHANAGKQSGKGR